MKARFKIISFLIAGTFLVLNLVLPYNIQSVLILRLLAYEKNIETRATNGVINIGILYNSADTSSRTELAKIKNALKILKSKGLKIKGYDFNLYTIPLGTENDLISILKIRKIKVLYITTGNRDFIKMITRVTRKLDILSITSDKPAKNVKNGISVGLGVKENKPKIYVNIKSSSKEGADFSAQFLALAEIIK